MTAYVIAQIDVQDADAYETYKSLAPAAIAAHGGKYIARGGALEILEGENDLPRTVILEFPDMATARTWYNSPEYSAAKAAREGAARTRFLLVDGVQE
ncbi:MAG: DUF1330 domain-containing protein [Rhodospirillales bacterium]